MSVAKYHIDIHGKPARCYATVQDCPRGGAGDHFGSYKEAEAAADARFSEAYGQTASVTKPTSSTAQRIATVNKQAEDAANALRIKVQNFQHDDEMMVDKINEKLPAGTFITDPHGRAEDGTVAPHDQMYPTTVVRTNNDGTQTYFHFGQSGVLHQMSGAHRDSPENQRFYEALKKDANVGMDIKHLAATRVKTQVAQRRAFDMIKTQQELTALQNQGTNSAYYPQRSLDLYHPVDYTDYSEFSNAVNAESQRVKLMEHTPAMIMPSHPGLEKFPPAKVYHIDNGENMGTDVTPVIQDFQNRYHQAGNEELRAIHRKAAIVHLESIAEQHQINDIRRSLSV